MEWDESADTLNVVGGKVDLGAAAELGIPRAHTLSVGNDFNDLDLLEWAQTRFVTANAPAELRERFPIVASNDGCGVAEAIARWIEVVAPS